MCSKECFIVNWNLRFLKKKLNFYMWSSYIYQKFKIVGSHIELYVLICD